ncbi:pantoate--beta-alanine ligase [Halalkalibacterium halodurans]|jgi:pantoate--beta-alanine ligase|uniref:Pantothenate synthetase n=2 Tax=Halalkalibacterium halodurans TaxID=86665 RepID=PANC_HALH5|nr:pantoate--beta-alanine ligase [Halalkalibacterium halodurans]Q9KC86.1 RecName: Full=Pantothenate synthetase; Short=PS; AltName: Full=Pantoate--beta-alanine ligase; AltName: Full=Pantoate-activating enzyme [Halalkalibacterium halodurans C-125]MDY7222258.1 pantoate--beta-alanine ligase [Halalkalibacterium halodurans]MDY7241479.1 pantoate--beta-alanine ligase [Halalkalibacterium halodurans]MED3646059.1 pantoate--beta-alanine ligase [Halalkalibacterium halodurans]MED4081336.1 pantoate--beta-ala
MIVCTTISDLQAQLRIEREQKRSVGFVPTMGYLHEGHLSLVKRAKEEHDTVVMSIFVNPLQFGAGEDLDTYPRDFARDEQLAEAEGVDILFYPSTDEMYPRPASVRLKVTQGVDVLCGASRPGHFDGVVTVVLKLFHLVEPDAAYFGLKDAQQVAVITNMVEDLNVGVQIVPCATVREVDGLAKSSRNVRLSEKERKEAPGLYQSLLAGREALDAGEKDAAVIRERIRQSLEERLTGRIDYVEVLSYPRLQKIERIEETVILAVAYQFENARLIDNLIVPYGE